MLSLGNSWWMRFMLLGLLAVASIGCAAQVVDEGEIIDDDYLADADDEQEEVGNSANGLFNSVDRAACLSDCGEQVGYCLEGADRETCESWYQWCTSRC